MKIKVIHLSPNIRRVIYGEIIPMFDLDWF